jgi:hypothetical protein
MSFKTIADVKAANKRRAKRIGRAYWFEGGAMRFFNTRIHDDLYGGKYFITSERYDEKVPYEYTIRKAFPDGEIDTVGEFQQYKHLDDARDAVKQLVRHRGTQHSRTR